LYDSEFRTRLLVVFVLRVVQICYFIGFYCHELFLISNQVHTLDSNMLVERETMTNMYTKFNSMHSILINPTTHP
jgi:hypothetical protein